MSEMKGYKKKLYSILEAYDNWRSDEEAGSDLAARAALLDFCQELKKFRPAREYVPGGMFHTSYIRSLLAVKTALAERQYTRACNEIISLMAYQPLLQGRVYYNLIKVLEEELVCGREEQKDDS